MRASAASAFTISRRCLRPTVRRAAGNLGSSGRESRSVRSCTRRRERGRRHRPPCREGDVFPNGQRRHRGRVLVHHADAVASGIPSGAERGRARRPPGSRRRRAAAARRRYASTWTCRRRSRPSRACTSPAAAVRLAPSRRTHAAEGLRDPDKVRSNAGGTSPLPRCARQLLLHPRRMPVELPRQFEPESRDAAPGPAPPPVRWHSAPRR